MVIYIEITQNKLTNIRTNGVQQVKDTVDKVNKKLGEDIFAVNPTKG